MLLRLQVSLVRATSFRRHPIRSTIFILLLAVIAFGIMPSRQTALAVMGSDGYAPSNQQIDTTQPQVGPGVPVVGSNAPKSAAGSTKAGSVLFFHKFVSDDTRPGKVNTLLTLTNTNPRDPINVRVFFVADCAVEDRFVTLVANQSRTFLASKELPGKSGYAIAVAVNSLGLPTQFNWLIGNVSLRDEWEHEASYNAFAVAKRSGGAIAINADAKTIDIVFNDIDYDRLPKLAAIDNLQNQDPAVPKAMTTDVAIVSPLADLSGTTPNSFKLTGTLYNSAGKAFAQDFNAACVVNASVSQIWTTPPFNTIIPADQAGWATFAAHKETNDLPVLGLSLTDAASAPLHNARVMQTLEWLDSFRMTLPVKLPATPVAESETQNQPDAVGGSSGVSENKAGSILLFPRFTSGTNGTTQIFLTNTNPTEQARLLVIYSGLADPVGVNSSIISLPALKTMSLDPNDLAPNQRGWVMVIAINKGVQPIQFNYLIGSAQVNETGGQKSSFNALAIAKNTSGPVPRNEDLLTSDLNFNGENYDRLPATTAMSFVPSQGDNSTLLGFSRVAASLVEPPNTRGAATVTFYDHLLAAFVANAPRTENQLDQLRPSPILPPITSTLKPGDHGWLKVLSSSPVISWSLNLAVLPFAMNGDASYVGGFSGDGNLHILTTVENYVVKVPASNPDNHPPVAVAETIGIQVEARRSTGTIVRLDGSSSSDEDLNDVLTFKWTDNSRSISTARIADTLLGIGTHEISLVVTDSSDLSSLPAEQTVMVVDTTPPQISGIPSTINKVTDSVSGDSITFALPIASDMVDGNVAVTASVPSGSVFPLGRTIVTFTAQDKAGNISTASMEVRLTFGVSQPQTGGIVGDKAPLMDNLNDQYVKAGETRNIQLQGTDPDGDSLTFSLLDAPSYAQIINSDPGSRSATLSIAPKQGETEGRANVRVVISDGRGQTFRTLPFNIIISDVPNDDTGGGAGQNKPPMALFESLPATIQATGKTGVELTLDASKSTDPDGDVLSFAWFDGDHMIAQGPVAKVTLAVGSHSIKLVVSDGKNGIVTAGPATVVVRPRTLTMTSVTPNRFGRQSAETLTITGAGFAPGAQVRFSKDGISITAYVSVEEDKIVATIAVSDKATPGFRDVYVVNPNGTFARLRSALYVNP